MSSLARGIALTGMLLLVPGGHILLILLVPLTFLALLMFRTTWRPVSTTYRPRSQATGPAEHE